MERIIGRVASTGTIGASLSGVQSIGASLDTSGAPYRGAYEVTPTEYAQVLPTAGKTPSSDIVVQPIPSNYGLITYNGSVITVS